VVNRPATPEEKLALRRDQAERFGKAFDENIERSVMGLPTVEDPIIIAESPDRRNLTQQEDRRGQRELEAQAAAARQRADMEELREATSRIKELERQVRELQGLPAEPDTRQPAAEEDLRGEGELPNEHWTKMQIMEYARVNALTAPEGGVNATKVAWLDTILTQIGPSEEGDAD